MAIAGGDGRLILPDKISLTGITCFSFDQYGNIEAFSKCPSPH
jgi:hypothetical protein